MTQKVRYSNLELYRIITMLAIVAHHYVVNSGLMGGCNLREFCFSEKVNIYRMLKTMKKMGVKKDSVPNGLKPLEFSESTDMGDVDDDKTCFDDGYVHNVKFTCGKDVQVVIKRCSPEVLARLIQKMREVC